MKTYPVKYKGKTVHVTIPPKDQELIDREDRLEAANLSPEYFISFQGWPTEEAATESAERLAISMPERDPHVIKTGRWYRIATLRDITY